MSTSMRRTTGGLVASMFAAFAAFGCGADPEEGIEGTNEIAEEPVLEDSQAIYYNGHSYKFSTYARTWLEARNACRDLYDDDYYGNYDLVKINNYAEEYWLHYQEESRGGGRWWIGANDRSKEGVWRWSVDNHLLGYTNWDAGEPNNYGSGEDCAVDGWSGGTWRDVKCSLYRRYICESEY